MALGFYTILVLYRVRFIFSDTLDTCLIGKWFILEVSLQNIKFTLISYQYFLKISLRSVKHGLSYDLKGNERSDQKITDKLIMLLLYLTSLPFGVDNDRKRIFYQKHSYCKNIYLVICKNQENTRIKDLMLKQWHS